LYLNLFATIPEKYGIIITTTATKNANAFATKIKLLCGV